MAVSSGPATSTSTAASGRRLTLVFVGLMLGMLIASLDQTIVATALPTIAGDLHDLSHLSWVVTAYILASTASTPLWGKLGDLYGRKRFFQAAIVLFLIGSVLAGISGSMVELIAFRALQGIGGGGLMVGAQTIIGDVVPPRDRGRYQGIFGAIFGVTSVIGPLLGGFFVDQLSWRWCFYINLPVGVIALVVTTAVLPDAGQRVHHIVDYLGTALLAAAATALVLLTTLGGTIYGWGSPPIIILAVAGAALIAAFILAERRAAEPVLPLSLFANGVFSATSAIGFVVGFAMFGAITYLPQYLQVVRGTDPTISGLELLPMMIGLLLTSIGSGQLISRWGHYKVFPIVGTGLMTLAMYLLSHLGVGTPTWAMFLFMFVLGVGIGGVMQVLVIAVQNAVGYEHLGVATSGATFFRSIGGSFGTAIFGAVFANALTGNLTHYLAGLSLPAGFSATAGASPAALAKLPAAVHTAYIGAYAASLQTVFLVATPIAAVAFILTWFLKEQPLRATTRVPDPADTYAPTARPSTRTSLDELQRAVGLLARGENRVRLYRQLAAAAGLDIDSGHCWLLYRLDERPGSTVAELSSHFQLNADRLQHGITRLGEKGLVTSSDGNLREGQVALTEAGRSAVERLAAARRERLATLLGDWSPIQRPELLGLMQELARDLRADDERLLAAAGLGSSE